MIREITIRNYKAFGDEEQQFELRHITLLIGKNSSGKSSLCKLLPMLSNALSGAAESQIMLRNHGTSLGTSFEDLFHNNNAMDLEFGVRYDSGLSIKTTYLLNAGKFYMCQYNAKTADDERTKSYHPQNQDAQGLIDYDIIQSLGVDPRELAFSVDYIGPLRIQAARYISDEGRKSSFVGIQGDDTYNILLNSYLRNDGLFEQVSAWTETHFDGQKLAMKKNTDGSYSLQVERRGASVNVADVGFGIAQSLPIIVQSFVKTGADISVIEQPALHLHPAAHADLAIRLAEAAKETNKKYLIETHSENFLLGLRKIVSDRSCAFSADDIIIYFVDADEEGAYLTPITMDENGELSWWPAGIFSESFDLLSAIMKNRR